MSEINLVVKATIDEDVAEEIEDFVRLSRLGNFVKGKDLYNAALASHTAMFPVAAEYADFLLEQGSYGRLAKFSEQVIENTKKEGNTFAASEVLLFETMSLLAILHSDKDLKDALVSARAIRQKLNKTDPQRLSDVEIHILELYLQIATTLWEMPNHAMMEPLDTQPPWSPDSIGLWKGFRTWCLALREQGRLWEAQKILRLLLPVLQDREAFELCEFFMEKLDSAQRQESVLITDLSTTNACTRFLVGQEVTSVDPGVLSKAQTWSLNAQELAKKIQDAEEQEIQGRPILEMRMAKIEIDWLLQPDENKNMEEAYNELYDSASKVDDFSLAAESLREMLRLSNEDDTNDHAKLDAATKLQNLQQNVMNDALGYVKQFNPGIFRSQHSATNLQFETPRSLEAAQTATEEYPDKSDQTPAPIPDKNPAKIVGTTSEPPNPIARPLEYSRTSTHNTNIHNRMMLQGFQWSDPADKGHWNRLRKKLKDLNSIGIDTIWLPPGCKAVSSTNSGHDVYDVYDLGEFDQKDSIATKWGTRDDLMNLHTESEALGIGLLWDAVIGYKSGADELEAVQVSRRSSHGDPDPLSQVKAPVGFTFPGRGETHSRMKYHWNHFTSFTSSWHKDQVFHRKPGSLNEWTLSASQRRNHDYSQNARAAVDLSQPEVKEDVKHWGLWITQLLGLKGLKFHGIHDISEDFLSEFIHHIRSTIPGEHLFFAELWRVGCGEMVDYISRMKYQISLLDLPLVHKFSEISKASSSDLRKVFDGSLVQICPGCAITFVTLADTEEHWENADIDPERVKVEDFFKPLAYSLILLRAEGLPCIPYGDFFVISPYETKVPEKKLPDLVLARKLYAYGEQVDYFDSSNCIGWVRRGTVKHVNGLACIMSITHRERKSMFVGTVHSGETWTDVLHNEKDPVRIDSMGNGVFTCKARSVSVWVNDKAKGREDWIWKVLF